MEAVDSEHDSDENISIQSLLDVSILLMARTRLVAGALPDGPTAH
jgi:hypothetical protein